MDILDNAMLRNMQRVKVYLRVSRADCRHLQYSRHELPGLVNTLLNAGYFWVVPCFIRTILFNAMCPVVDVTLLVCVLTLSLVQN